MYSNVNSEITRVLEFTVEYLIWFLKLRDHFQMEDGHFCCSSLQLRGCITGYIMTRKTISLPLLAVVAVKNRTIALTIDSAS